MKALRSKTVLRLFTVAIPLLLPSALRAAEAYYVIDAGFIVGVDTDTGATVASFGYSTSPSGPGGLQFTSRDSLHVLDATTGIGNRVYRYTPSGSNTWTQSGNPIEQHTAPLLKAGKDLALQRSGLLLGIGQNSHDLWEVQRINYSPAVPGSEFAGRVRNFSPDRFFPTRLAASPLGESYAVWFFNGTLVINNDGTDQFTIANLGTADEVRNGGLCYDYAGYPYTDPNTQITTTHSLLYVSNGNGNTVRRYDAVTFQPYGKPSDRSNPVLISPGTGGMTGIDRIAIDAETGTLYAMGRHQNYVDGLNNPDIVIAGFSTADGTPRGLGGSTTDPVVYHRPWGNSVAGFTIRPGVQVQQYDGGTHILGSSNFSDPGRTLSLVNIGASPATVELPAESRHLEVGGLNRISGQFSNTMRAVSAVGSINSIISAAIARSGGLKLSTNSTVTVTSGVTASDGGTIELQPGSTLNSPAGSVIVGAQSRVSAAMAIIAAQSLRAESGGTIAPGASPGEMTVQGNVELLPGSILEIEIAGPQAGVTHDLLTVQNAAFVSLNGNVIPQLTSGFVPQSTDVFTVLASNVALTGTIQNLANGRVFTANGRGSFAVSVINSGRDLQLSDYQPVPAYQAWLNLNFTPEQQTQPAASGDAADPDFDGYNNLLEAALNTNPFGGGIAGVPIVARAASGGPAFTFPRYAGGTTTAAGYEAGGLRYIIERSTAFDSWVAVHPGDPEVSAWTVMPTGDGIMEMVRVDFNSTGGPQNFLRLRVEKL